MKSKLSIPHSAPFISKEDMIAVNRVLATGMIARGSENDALEKEFCSFTGKAFASTTTSGSSALIVALNALKIAKNDEVIVPTYVCKSVLHAIK